MKKETTAKNQENNILRKKIFNTSLTWLYIASLIITIVGTGVLVFSGEESESDKYVSYFGFFFDLLILMCLAIPFCLFETEIYRGILCICEQKLGNWDVVYRTLSLILSICMIINLFYNDHSHTIKYQEIRWILLICLYLALKIIYWAVKKKHKT